uniref:Uncharacterized protein n=1 Tax=Globodera rostochiensis TaxID=31243 RepID=A0A914I788_GLORO
MISCCSRVGIASETLCHCHPEHPAAEETGAVVAARCLIIMRNGCLAAADHAALIHCRPRRLPLRRLHLRFALRWVRTAPPLACPVPG